MAWRDTPTHYGLVTRLLHWGMAALFLWQFFGMSVKVIVGRSPLTAFLVGTHGAVGTLLMTLLVLRALWALSNLRRRPSHGGGLSGRLVAAGHLMLYGLMLVIPALALLRQYGSGKGFSPFGIPLMAQTGQEAAWMIAPARAFHGWLGWTLLALIAGHVFMVILHRVRWRDETWSRMAGPLKRPA